MEKIIENFSYHLDTENKTAKVISYIGNLVDITIPKFVKYKFKKYEVTSIEEYAFYKRTSLKSVIIPNSVTEIGKSAFKDCYCLTSVNIPDSVTKIGDYAFQFCGSLQSITIPNGVTKIGNMMFKYCISLKSITIPNSVTEIGDSAFAFCNSLTSIDIPNSVTKIGRSALAFNKKLISITIPNSVTSIDYIAFCRIGLTLPKRYTEDGKLIAYKAFMFDMTCRGFQYEEGKTYEIEGEIKCCYVGFHACTNPLDVFNYYYGEIGKHIYIHEVYLNGEIDENKCDDSKVCASKIEIGKRLTMQDINNIINSK